MNNLKISVGILTWGSHQTLRNTLASYKSGGLLEFADEVILFAQEGTDHDYDIAEEFGISNVILSPSNIGIGKAFTELVKAARNEVVLILENDWCLIENRVVTYNELYTAIGCISNGKFDFIRLRHALYPGEPLYTYQYKNREMDSPEHLLDAVHWNKDLNLKYPNFIGKQKFDNDVEYLTTHSYYGNHTNNPFICSKTFFLTYISPFAGEGVALEGGIRDYWRSKNFKVSHSTRGLFSHYRIDR